MSEITPVAPVAVMPVDAGRGLEEVVRRLNINIGRAITALQTAREGLAAVQALAADYQGALSSSGAEHADFRQQLETLTEAVSVLVDESDRLSASVVLLEQAQGPAEARVSELEQGLAALAQQAEALAASAVTAGQARAALAAADADLDARLDIVEPKLPALAAADAALANRVAAAETALTSTQAGLTSTQAALSTAQSAITALQAALTAAQSATTALQVRRPRVASGTSPAVTVVLAPASADLTLTWPTPWPDTSYDVMVVVEPPASLLGKVAAVVKTKSTGGVVVTVTTSATLAAGAAGVRALSVSST